MRLGLLETGAPPEALRLRFGGYPRMFERLLGRDYVYSTFDVQAGRLPDRAEENEAYIVTGSSCGVYDPLPWIEDLKAWLVEAKGRARLVGICFGHQVMAEAFGGRVIKAPQGWAVGLHTYRMVRREPWTDGAATISIPVSHQDQVVELPPAAEVVACSDFTLFAVLAYRDQPAISFQCHPEFEPAFAEALIEARRGTRFSNAEADRAVESLRRPNDRPRVAGWIRNFLAAE